MKNGYTSKVYIVPYLDTNGIKVRSYKTYQPAAHRAEREHTCVFVAYVDDEGRILGQLQQTTIKEIAKSTVNKRGSVTP